jgi:NAD(P)-dependent dehydrogenase (short-subunit alcohol dehydrogenase family)
MTSSFENKVVVVTGANAGIGEGAANAFSKAGARVFGIVRREDAHKAARSRHPHIHWLLADVSDAHQVKGAVESAVREAGTLDILVNNAGAFNPGPIEEATEETIKAQFSVNVFGSIYAVLAALPALKDSRGCIVNISSAAGHRPTPGASVYASSKAALESLTLSWAVELAPHGVRVNAVAPGPVDTTLFEKAGFPAEAIPAIKASFIKQVPLGRMGTIEEVTRWIVAISDPAAAWLTGQVLSVDGGMSLT